MNKHVKDQLKCYKQETAELFNFRSKLTNSSRISKIEELLNVEAHTDFKILVDEMKAEVFSPSPPPTFSLPSCSPSCSSYPRPSPFSPLFCPPRGNHINIFPVSLQNTAFLETLTNVCYFLLFLSPYIFSKLYFCILE